MARRPDRTDDAVEGRAWSDTYHELTALPPEERGAADCERLAVAAYMIGEDDECVAAWESAHHLHVDDGDLERAAFCSFWLAFCLLLRGQGAPAAGWLGRTESIVADLDTEVAATGYLLIPGLLGALEAGDPPAARAMAIRATEIGERVGDADLRAFGTLGHGQALVALGDTAAGTARLDEVMVAVTAGETGPITSGIVYCAVILECMQMLDLARAAEWTDALQAWCDAQVDLVPYRGQCLVHRSQLQQAAGDWPAAATTVESACLRLTDPPHPALGLAQYQQAELHRLRGEFDAAADGYRRANRNGYQPMPGLALLDLARGDADAAAAAIHRALQEGQTSADRAALLAAAVDVFRSVGALADARAAADELTALAGRSSSEVLAARAAAADGSILLAEGDPAAALPRLRAAASAWRALHMPYETARTTVLLGLACAALGDRASSELELDAARGAFADLGARPDLDRVEALIGDGRGRTTDSEGSEHPDLTGRELEVLALVAEGRTNRQIASELVISAHTVSRHLENIFGKFGVSTRAAATAHAFERGLL